MTYVKREANEAAHRFNKVSLIFMDKLIHTEKTLNYIIDIVCVERFALDFLSNEYNARLNLKKKKKLFDQYIIRRVVIQFNNFGSFYEV